jgi:predicted neutral ceramidase superfamily lipid hydrolase
VRARPTLKSKQFDGDGPLSRVPPLAAFLVVAAVFVVGVLVRGVPGALLLGLLAAGVAVMLAATWGALTQGQRFGRILVLGVLAAVAVSVVLVK